MRAKLIQKLFMGLFVVALYFRTERHQDGLISLMGVLFYFISELTYSTAMSIQTYMPNDFPLLVREYHDGIYPVYIYYIAKVCSSFPHLIQRDFSFCRISLFSPLMVFC